MITKYLVGGATHKLPDDLRNAILTSRSVTKLWEDITPLARNEWICWVISGKKQETRNIRITKALSKMKAACAGPAAGSAACIEATSH